jgi:hypothetical protein
MKVYLLAITCLVSIYGVSQSEQSKAVPQVSSLTIADGEVTTLHLCAGYTTSLRLPEEISSVVVGNPAKFKAEHATSEPRLVFLKPLTNQREQSNALITTKSGAEINLHLISECSGGRGSPVDFFVEYRHPESPVLNQSESPSFTVAPMQPLATRELMTANLPSVPDQVLINESRIAAPDWQGNELRVAIGQSVSTDDRMIVGFSVLNSSQRPIELLPPQIELSGKERKKKQIKADPIATAEYRFTAQRLEPGQRADGVVVFERPTFKESNESLALAVAVADEVDHPVIVPLPFTAKVQGGAQ